MRNRLAVAVLSALTLLSACGGGEDTGPEVSFPPPDQAADQALVEKMLLTAEQMPEGFEESTEPAPASLTSLEPGSACTSLVAADVLGQPPLASATSKVFERNPDSDFETTISSTAELHQDAERTAATITGFNNPDNDLCLRRLIEPRVATPIRAIGGSTENLNARLERIEPLTGPDTFGLRLIGTTFANRQAVNVYVDVIGVRMGRGLSTATLTALNSSPSLEMERDLIRSMRRQAAAATADAG